jgi:dTDP-4-amino-4,6-dideoxygalactose transaminase
MRSGLMLGQAFQMKITHDYSISVEEKHAALNILNSGEFFGTDQEDDLEKEYCSHFGRRYAVAVSSGTAALHCALLACHVGLGDEVIAPPNTDWAILYSILYTGAKPVFCDVDYETMNLDPSKLEERITSRTKAIIAVSTAGHSVDFDPILDAARRHGVIVVNDLAQALGAKYKGRYCDTFGDMSVCSFGRYKHITSAGHVGIVSTDNGELAESVHTYSHQGEGRRHEKDPVETYVSPLYPHFREYGYRYGPSELHCAIARVQLRKFISGSLNPERRRRNAARYTRLLNNSLPEIITPIEKDWAYHTYLRYIIRTTNRDNLFRFLMQKRIRVFIHYAVPLHLFEMVKRNWGSCEGMFPVSERLSKEVLTLPSWASLTGKQVEYVVRCVEEFYK